MYYFFFSPLRVRSLFRLNTKIIGVFGALLKKSIYFHQLHTHTKKITPNTMHSELGNICICVQKYSHRVRLTNIYTTAATALLSSSCRLWCTGRCFKTGTSFGRRSWSHTNVQYHWHRWYAATAITPVGRYRKSFNRWSRQLVSIAGRKSNDK